MRALLDTHTLIWASVAADRLGKQAREILQDGRNELHVSLASFWEIGIKMSKPQSKLALPANWDQQTDAYVRESGWHWLSIRVDHCRAVRALPWRRHRDPFDRMLIAQAQVERLAILTSDKSFGQYDVPVVW
ncbi:MAG: type II toxin-antitoxin system VapC family toxin [Rhodanobacteraceae bacterium]